MLPTQNLVEKIVRLKVYSMTYWKEHCFGLNAETLVDKAMDLDHVGGTYGGNQKATDFLCLVLKMCQIQPEKEIVVRVSHIHLSDIHTHRLEPFCSP
jgi:pre-mRNA-splicing factor 38A